MVFKAKSLHSSSATLLVRDFLVSAAMQQAEMVCYFIESEGLHPDTTMEGKPTALCYAVMKKNRCILEYLVSKGAGIDRCDALGMTPLHYAVLGGCLYCVAYLLSRGANINTRNCAGKTPLALALDKNGSDECRELLERHGASLSGDTLGAKRFH